MPAELQQGGGLVAALVLGAEFFELQTLVALLAVSRFCRGLLSRSQHAARNILSRIPALQPWVCTTPRGSSLQSSCVLQNVKIACQVSQAAAAWKAYDRRAHMKSDTKLSHSFETLSIEAATLSGDLPPSAIGVYIVRNGMSLGSFAGAEVPGFGGRLLALGESLALATPSHPSQHPAAAGAEAGAGASRDAAAGVMTCRALFLPVTAEFGGRRMWLNRHTGAVHIGPRQPPCTSGEHFAALTPGQQAAAIFGRAKHSSLLSLLRHAAGLVT